METVRLLWQKIIQKRLSRLLLAIMVITAAVNSLGVSVQTVFNGYIASESKKKLPIYCVDTPEKKIAITFDAAWGADDTDELLAILKEYDAKATFFLCGYWVKKYPEEVKRMYAAGHDIGNHGDTHAHGAKLSLEQNVREIKGAHDKIKELLGIDIKLYRPPFGEYNDTVLDAAKSLGYYTIQWDVDSHDWMNKGVEYEINQILNHKHLGNGSILLFHNDAKDTPKALPVILKGLKEKGFKMVPVSELIYKDNYYMDHEGRQKLKTVS